MGKKERLKKIATELEEMYVYDNPTAENLLTRASNLVLDAIDAIEKDGR